MFQFQTSRSGAHARAFLVDWQGMLFSQGVAELGCWAQARCKWHQPHLAGGGPVAAAALAGIGALYPIEEASRSMRVEQRHGYRQALAVRRPS